VRTRIDRLLLDMLEPRVPDSVLRESVVEELGRAVKRADVVLEYLGLKTIGLDSEGKVPLLLVQPHPGTDPWRNALLVPGGDSLVIASLRGKGPDGFRALTELTYAARRAIQLVDPSVLVSPDGRVWVQLGSLSDTTRNLLREGVHGEHVFILPLALFEGRTNYSDVEILVYLNFFVRGGRRTRIVGTPAQRRVLTRLLTLTVFGLFEPGVARPTFERLRRVYGVPDRQTYTLLRAAHEMYSVRQGSEPSSPILPIDGYIDFIALEGDERSCPSRPRREARAHPAAESCECGRTSWAPWKSASCRRTASSPPSGWS
jgi:hypothetical protein